jgi:molecular chaperone DnaK (HSP70)
VAGIDLGTTNSVICVQEQASTAGVGRIACISDPQTGSPIIPSVVSFLEPHEHHPGSKSASSSSSSSASAAAAPATARTTDSAAVVGLDPDPSRVLVGRQAKLRVDTHPHHTIYSAKRVLGRSYADPAVAQLRNEVEFDLVPASHSSDDGDGDGDGSHPHAIKEDRDDDDSIRFRVPGVSRLIPPYQIGSYVVQYLSRITQQALGHDNVKSAVICVPAQFTPLQREHTVRAFLLGGIQPVRILEEPTAAALAYDLHTKEGVDYVLVYDFGGGTLDVSLLRVTSGFVDVLGSDGDDLLGGTDFDAAIAHSWMDRPVRIESPEEDGDTLEETGGSVVSRTLHHLQHLQSLLGHDVDLEGRLASECSSRLVDIPLCTVSSFHSLAEQVKIELSSFSSSTSSTKTTTTTTAGDEVVEAAAAGIAEMAEATCLAPPRRPPSDPESSSSFPAAYSSVEQFCADLIPVRLSLSGMEFLESIDPLLRRSLLPVTRLLEEVGLVPQEVPEVVMVGGTTRLHAVRLLVGRYFSGSTINTSIDPDLTVAYGAASVID